MKRAFKSSTDKLSFNDNLSAVAEVVYVRWIAYALAARKQSFVQLTCCTGWAGLSHLALDDASLRIRWVRATRLD